MKRHNLLTLPLLTSFLVGCSSSSISGYYQFQMGKSNDTHFGIYLMLSDEIVKDEFENNLGKRLDFEFALETGMEEPDEQAVNAFNASKAVAKTLIRAANDANDYTEDIPTEIGDFGIQGYYVHNPELIQKDDKGEEIIPVGITGISYDDDEGKRQVIDGFTLPPEFVEKLIYNTYSSSVFTMVLPVSIEDCLLQLYWYGFDIENFEDVEVHAVGTSPTSEEIAAINLTYPLNHGGRMFRNFYKVHMGLSKK